MNFEFPPHLSLARLPTPFEKPIRLNQGLEGHQIYIKRDDLTGCVLSGNKIRKLEFVLFDALREQADTIITCGGIQSNHARATAFAAAKYGLQSHLVLRGQLEDSQSGNLFLNRLVGADFTFISAEDYRDRVDEIMSALAADLRRKGKKPYIIPEGASNALGSMGYLNACDEIRLQWQKMNTKIDLIVTAVGSGGTYAGLLLGKFLFDLDCQIVGFNVAADAAYFTERIFKIIQDVKIQFGLDLGIRKTDIQIVDGYVGAGYALSQPEEIDLIKQLAVNDGLILDPVYTAKALLGLLDQLNQGAFADCQNILFVHTGGIFGLFPNEELFK